MSRLLVVEDDHIQQAVLKAALESRGYEIEVASDGLTAVQMLRAGGFDLALIDYQLPEIDGLASARLLHDLMNEEDRPRLIAVTAATESLSRRQQSDGAFDAIIPKPLDLPALFAMVDSHLRASAAGQTTRAAEATWRQLGLEGAPAVVALPAPSPVQAQLLRCYFDLTGRRGPEAVLLLGLEAAPEAMAARTRSGLFALPFVSLAAHDASADAAFSAADGNSWAGVADVITRFQEQRRLVAPGVLLAADLDTRLLIYLFASGRPFLPALGFDTPECARYPGFFESGEILSAAERLADRGLLDRHFSERFHACGNCGSSRLNVREECPVCRSSQLRPVPLVHHFRCGHQALEADFVRGAHLVCPECRGQLHQVGIDYDKSGLATSCGSCGIISPEAAVGFSCLDCGAHTDGDAALKRDVFRYALTKKGTASVCGKPWHEADFSLSAPPLKEVT